MALITAIILTLDEQLHLERCIKSIQPICENILVVDSGSTDSTVEIAERLGAKVISNAWVNHASQLNFAIKELDGVGGWLFRIDADEVFDETGINKVHDLLDSAPIETAGFTVRRRIHFLGRRVRHGAVEPSFQLRLWREGRGECEQRWMDEHVKVDGEVGKSDLIISDINLNSLTWWTAKHNSYASREAIEILDFKYGLGLSRQASSKNTSKQAQTRRFLKERVYRYLPRGIRPALYFFYRYLARFGFLDGIEGMYFHFLQGFWYRMLVDAKVREIEKYSREHSLSLGQAVEAKTGIKV